MSPATRAHFWLVLTFLLIVVLVIGGLGLVTAAALRVERSDQVRLALWRLDSRVSPSLAREDSRPFQHFDALYVPLPALQRDGAVCSAGSVVVPSPLLGTVLPDWMLLHFQVSANGAWRSPQVPSPELLERLRRHSAQLELANVTPKRAERLQFLNRYAAGDLLAQLPPDDINGPVPAQTAAAQQAQLEGPWSQSQQMWAPNRDNDYQQRTRTQRAAKAEVSQNIANNNFNAQVAPIDDEFALTARDAKWLAANPVALMEVKLGPFHPLWMHAADQPEQLVIARSADMGKQRIVQGVLLDWSALRELLLGEIRDLFPQARLDPVTDDAGDRRDRMMTTLPVYLDTGPLTATGWSPLRTGLAVAWLAALGALTVVGFGGRSLLELSERRIRFVSAVTHELRTPLTTLRLYLDMLTSGMVKDETKKTEYLHTLHGESDRLNRLVDNVLDFARLERQRPQLVLRDVPTAGLLDHVHGDWADRCKATGKELLTSNECTPNDVVHTDSDLVRQILGNLIDNACKYTREATDNRIWMRARRDGGRLVIDVEDRGPGIPARERHGVFQAFRRGGTADVTAGGVGLGLALARRWAQLLGGRLDVVTSTTGACFRLRLP